MGLVLARRASYSYALLGRRVLMRILLSLKLPSGVVRHVVCIHFLFEGREYSAGSSGAQKVQAAKGYLVHLASTIANHQ